MHQHDASCDHVCALDPSRETTSGEKVVSIRDLEVGQQGRVVQVNARGAVRQRLLDMGLLPDVPVRLERLAPTGDPLWISLQESQIALRRKEAESVLIVGE